MGTNLMDFYLANGTTGIVNWDLLRPRNAKHGEHWESLDLCDAGDVMARVRTFQPDAIFHLGARTDLRGSSIADYPQNTDGVRNLIDACTSLSNPPRVIFASSRLVCRIGYQPHSDSDYCPTNPYGESKCLGEVIVRGAGGSSLDWLIVRPTSIWGPWFRTPYRDFFDAVSLGRYVHPGSVPIHKSFGFVGNSIFQLDRLMFDAFDRVRGKTVYLADYPPLELRSWAVEVARSFGKGNVRSAPVPALKALALLGDLAVRFGLSSAPLTSFRLNNLMTDMVYDTTVLEEVVGELPFSLKEGIEMTVAWIADQR